MTLAEAFMLDHAPSEIVIQSPTIELTAAVEKCLEKYFKQE
jgi:hypothetical protein